MFEHRIQFLTAVAAVSILIVSPAVFSDTWKLTEDGQLSSMEQRGEFAKSVAEIKQLAEEGEVERFRQALSELKRKFPDVTGPEFDFYMEAEQLFCEGRFEKAFIAYERFLNRFGESELYQAALERQFAIGSAFLQGRKKRVLKFFKIRGYAEGARIMEKIADRSGDAPIAQKALKSIALSYERRKNFEQAYQQWSVISSRWPAGEIAKEALLGMARCKHAAYKGPRFDNSNLISAKGYYEKFKLIYSEDAKELDIDKRLELIEEQVAYKKFQIGQYYKRTGIGQLDPNQLNPAYIYYDAVLRDWPESTAAKMTKEAMQGERNPEEKVKE